MSLPENLHSLHSQEELLRTKALEFIASNSEMQDHIATAEVAMDLLNYFARNAPLDTEDQKVIAYLAIRVFNDMGAAWKLISSGYFQVAAMVQRDVVETVFLVGYFRLKPEMVAVWRTADEKTRRDTFKPVAIRIALDDAAGKGVSKRKAIYSMFSTLAAHPTIESLAMLRPDGKDAAIGPYMEAQWLNALLAEHAKVALQAGMEFNNFLRYDTRESHAITFNMMTAMMTWMERYHGATFSDEAKAELKQLFGG